MFTSANAADHADVKRDGNCHERFTIIDPKRSLPIASLKGKDKEGEERFATLNE